MTKTEAAQQALDALDELREFGHHVSLPKWARISIALKAALKAVLDQPEQKPLTEEEASALIMQDYCMEEYYDSAMELIRRVEQAHGIGEKP